MATARSRKDASLDSHGPRLFTFHNGRGAVVVGGGEGVDTSVPCCVLCFVGRDEMFWPRAAAAADGREITKAKFLHS